MSNDNNDLLGLGLILLVGVIGTPVAVYQLISDINQGWVCYSRHGHILESVPEAQLHAGVTLLLTVSALGFGLFLTWKRLRPIS